MPHIPARYMGGPRQLDWGWLPAKTGGAGHYAEYVGTRDGVELMNAGDQYLKYIAERPRSHGLFSNTKNTSLDDMMQEVNSHTAPVWTFIYSLKREDAVQLGYNSAENWRKLLLAYQTELAEAMKIPPNQLRWCAAFHDEKYHPHVHMMVWSADSKQGYASTTSDTHSPRRPCSTVWM